MFTCAEISKCDRISSECCTHSSNCKGIRVACCFLNTGVALKSRFNSTLIFPMSYKEFFYVLNSFVFQWHYSCPLEKKPGL